MAFVTVMHNKRDEDAKILLKLVRLYCAGMFLAATFSFGASAQEFYELEIPSTSVSEAMKSFSYQTGRSVLFQTDDVDAVKANAISGRYAVDEALNLLLASTNLSGGLTESGVITISLKIGNDREENSMASGKIKTGLLASASALLIGAGGGALAQGDATTAGDNKDDVIIVTAQKREQDIQDVPMSIVALGAADIKERGIQDFVDLSLAVPGLSVADSGGFQRRIYLRGVGNITGSSPLVGIYLDEVPLSGGSALRQLDLRTYDLERIEVLRGPQGTLYGVGSVGGTIRFITKKPDTKEFSFNADAEAAFTEGGAPSQRIQSAINIPLIRDELAVRVVGTFENLGGWIDQPAAAQNDINDQNIANVRAKLLWTPSEEFELGLMANIHRNDAGAPSIGEDEDGNFVQAFGRINTPTTQDDYEIYNLKMGYDFGGASLLSSSSYLNKEGNVTSFTFGVPGLALFEEFVRNEAEIFSQEVRLTSETNAPLQWTVGGFYQNSESSDEDSFELGLIAGPPFLGPILNSVTRKSESWAVFGEGTFALSNSLELGAGVRYFEDDRQFSDAGGLQEDKFDAVSPRFFARYDIADDVSLYANVAKGFRSGGFNVLGEPSFGPETSWSYELGTKSSFFDGAAGLEFALFYTEIDNYQLQGTPLGGITSLTSNSGAVEIRGVEWAATLQVIEGLTLGFNGNYVDAEYVEIRATGTDLMVGDRVEFIPKYQFDASINYDFDFGQYPASFRLDYVQQGKSVRLGRTFGAVGESDEINMLNLNIGLDWNENLSFGVFAKNLLDDRGFLDPLAVQRIAPRSRPRTVGVRMSISY